MVHFKRFLPTINQIVGLVLFTLFSTCISAQALAAANAKYVAGKDYRLIHTNTPAAKSGQKVQVIEFFNYGCPACYFMEPAIQKWLKANRTKITFSRVPVIFHPEWEPLSKAYFIAKAYNRLDTLTPTLFTKIHLQKEDLSSPDKLATVFQHSGIPITTFNQAYFHSPALTQQLQDAANLQARYNIVFIPTLVIDNRYVLDMDMAGTPEHFLATLDYLIRYHPK
jgi:thiol:disulfide interchange protein DsbA